MPLEPQDIAVYHSGATQAGNAQRDASASLGGWKSTSLVQSIAFELANAISGVVILFASGTNGIGQGQLIASASTLTWQAPGDTPGVAVTINDGETKNLQSNDTTKFIQVTRTSSEDLTGRCIVTLSKVYHNAICLDPCVISDAPDYRMLVVSNDSGTDANGVKVWVGNTGDIEIALDFPDATGMYQDISDRDEITAPAGLSFSAPTTEGAALTFNLLAGEIKGLWLKRTPPGAGISTGREIKIYIKSPAGDTMEYFGLYALGDPAFEMYKIYKSENGGPLGLAETFTALPHDYSDPLDFNTVYEFRVTKQNKYGLESQNLETFRIETDGTGLEVRPVPSAPVDVAIEALPGGAMRLSAFYYNSADKTDQADQWLIYLKTGADPDPGVDVPTVVAMVKTGGIVPLDWTSSAYATGADVRALVRVRRSADTKDSNNTNIVSETALSSIDAPTASCDGVSFYTEPDLVKAWQHDANNYIEVDLERNVLRFIVDGNIALGVGRNRVVQLKGKLIEQTLVANEVMAQEFEYSAGLIKIGVGDGTLYKQAELDASGNLTVNHLLESNTYPDSNYAGLSYYDNDSDTLKFSADLIDTLFAINKTGGPVFQGTLECTRLRENG